MSYAKFKTLGEQDIPPFNPGPQPPQNQAQEPYRPPPQGSQSVIKISSLAHKNSIVAGNKICLVDVYTEWCGPCKVIGPHFENLAHKYSSPGHCVLVKEDAEDGFNPSVTGVPAFDFFYEGKQVHRLVGVDIDTVEAKLLELLAK